MSKKYKGLKLILLIIIILKTLMDFTNHLQIQNMIYKENKIN